MRLAGKVALVAYGELRPGEAVVRQLLADGATVVSLRPEPREGTALPGLDARTVDVEDVTRLEALALDLREQYGRLNAVVLLPFRPRRAPAFLAASIADWERCVDGALRMQFALARAFIPVLRSVPGAAFIEIADATAQDPSPKAGIAAIAAAGQLMMVRALAQETGGHPRVHCLVLSEPAGRPQSDDWLTVANVGEVVARLIADPDAARGETALAVGWRERLQPGSDAVSYL
jgi:NAD(P)-dependent dehydrogenase (short-subunit alcohol dehydrogenase family)